MKLYSYNEVKNIVKIDDEMSDDFSCEVDSALESGFDVRYPIVISEDGFIIDGNHRFVAFSNEDRSDELVFIVVNHLTFTKVYGKEIESGNRDKFVYDHDYFYSLMRQISI